MEEIKECSCQLLVRLPAAYVNTKRTILFKYASDSKNYEIGLVGDWPTLFQPIAVFKRNNELNIYSLLRVTPIVVQY